MEVRISIEKYVDIACVVKNIANGTSSLLLVNITFFSRTILKIHIDEASVAVRYTKTILGSSKISEELGKKIRGVAKKKNV